MTHDKSLGTPLKEAESQSETRRLEQLRAILEIEDDAEWAEFGARLGNRRLALQLGELILALRPKVDRAEIEKIIGLISRAADVGQAGDGEHDEVVVVAVPKSFVRYVESQGLSPQVVMAAFAHDLAETPFSNGSDERAAANAWFRRVIWPDPSDDLDSD